MRSASTHIVCCGVCCVGRCRKLCQWLLPALLRWFAGGRPCSREQTKTSFALRDVRIDQEKITAFQGFVNMVNANPQVALTYPVEFSGAIASLCPPPPQLHQPLQQILLQAGAVASGDTGTWMANNDGEAEKWRSVASNVATVTSRRADDPVARVFRTGAIRHRHVSRWPKSGQRCDTESIAWKRNQEIVAWHRQEVGILATCLKFAPQSFGLSHPSTAASVWRNDAGKAKLGRRAGGGLHTFVLAAGSSLWKLELGPKVLVEYKDCRGCDPVVVDDWGMNN
eukprot:s1481_g4.t1